MARFGVISPGGITSITSITTCGGVIAAPCCALPGCPLTPFPALFFDPCRPRTATIGSRQHGCLHPVVSTMQGGANQACRALVNKRACKW